ncbi:H-NS-and StpA-binding protein [Citrobacter koseri]|uniref:H-NS-and StpA-binding protein n=1 Tax=Citrobacter koseri TaxID=545 RepID=A0A2X2WPK2_CITKO|nr:H-NS-and StpA-binding protein [Citrobacter koseri]
MTVQDYLLKFRKISSLESLEKLFDHLNYTLSDDREIINMYRASRSSSRGAGLGRSSVMMSVRCQNQSGITYNKESSDRR